MTSQKTSCFDDYCPAKTLRFNDYEELSYLSLPSESDISLFENMFSLIKQKGLNAIRLHWQIERDESFEGEQDFVVKESKYLRESLCSFVLTFV